MDWNSNVIVPFVSHQPENSFGFVHNYNYDQLSGLEIKQTSAQHAAFLPTLIDKNDRYGLQQDFKKKRLSNEQLESLENSFQDEIKLDPDRKMKLSRELGMQPRQIAVWFQNRRARWKAKQLERLYDVLKQEFDNVSREKEKLQQEVLALRAIVLKQQVSTGYTEVSGEETVESTSIPGSINPAGVHQIAECNSLLNMEDYNQAVMMPPYWTNMP